MRQVTIFTVLFVSLVAVLARPPPELVGNVADQGAIFKQSQKTEITNTLKSLDLMDLTTQDYMANLIYALLKITAGQFLTLIDNSMRNSHYEINQGMIELQQLKPRLDSATQQKIQNVINKALDDALSSIQPIINDLGMVLPSITRSTSSRRGVSDVIYILLQISFEDFLQKIATVMERSLTIFSNTMGELSSIANTIPDSAVANDLRRISNTRLERARSLIRPVLTDLRKVIPSRDSIDVMTQVISKAVGFDVVTTAVKLDTALEQVETTMTDFVKNINNILGFSHPSIRKEVNQILKVSVNNVESTIEPILKVFLHFVPSDGTQDRREDYKEIISTLLGLSLEDFLFYVDFAIPRIQEIYNKAVIEIRSSCVSSQPLLLIQILQLIDRTMESLESAVEPFITQISPILGDKRWVTVEEFVEITKDDNTRIRDANVFCNFSLRSGYNKGLIIHLISKIFGFDISAAATEMISSLHELDNLYIDSSHQLNRLVANLHPYVVAEVNRILADSLNVTRRAMLPAIGVFIEFIPTEGRQEKDIVAGIVHALEGLKYEHFKNYVKEATETSGEIAENAQRYIHQIVKSGRLPKTTGRHLADDSLLDQVDAVMFQTLRATHNIAKPFYDIISPVFEP